MATSSTISNVVDLTCDSIDPMQNRESKLRRPAEVMDSRACQLSQALHHALTVTNELRGDIFQRQSIEAELQQHIKDLEQRHAQSCDAHHFLQTRQVAILAELECLKREKLDYIAQSQRDKMHINEQLSHTIRRQIESSLNIEETQQELDSARAKVNELERTVSTLNEQIQQLVSGAMASQQKDGEIMDERSLRRTRRSKA